MYLLEESAAFKWIWPVQTHVVQGLAVFLLAKFANQNVTNNNTSVLVGMNTKYYFTTATMCFFSGMIGTDLSLLCFRHSLPLVDELLS